MLQITHETTAGIRIQKARTTLLLDHPFFGSLLFRLKGRENRSIATMATDGVSLYYNPEFVDTLNSATLAGVLAHEVMHPALQHHVRRSGRDPKRWNEACDYAINPLLLDAGLSLPDGVLVDHRFRGMSAEQIYNLRDAEAQPQSGGQNSGDVEVPELARVKRQKSKPARMSQLRQRRRAALARFLMHLYQTKRRRVRKSRRESGVLLSTRQSRSRSKPARLQRVWPERSKESRRQRWTGASCCVGFGPTPSPQIRVGCGLTAATSGTDSICQEWCARASERLPLLSIAQAR
jgi:hypothetical protein